MGPGIVRRNDSMQTVSKVIEYSLKYGKRVVVDADAIYAVAKFKTPLNKNAILTPNQKEFEMLCGSKMGESLSGRMNSVLKLARKLHTNILLKGHETIVSDGTRKKIVRAKSSALAVMGTGDVLSGIIGAFAVKNKDLFVCGVAGAYLHDKIGDELYLKMGNHILASDVVDRIPKMLKGFDKNIH